VGFAGTCLSAPAEVKQYPQCVKSAGYIPSASDMQRTARLCSEGLPWITGHVMERTGASLMNTRSSTLNPNWLSGFAVSPAVERLTFEGTLPRK